MILSRERMEEWEIHDEGNYIINPECVICHLAKYQMGNRELYTFIQSGAFWTKLKMVLTNLIRRDL